MIFNWPGIRRNMVFWLVFLRHGCLFSGNISNLHVPSDRVWLPDIVLFNKWVIYSLSVRQTSLKFQLCSHPVSLCSHAFRSVDHTQCEKRISKISGKSTLSECVVIPNQIVFSCFRSFEPTSDDESAWPDYTSQFLLYYICRDGI